MLGAAALRSNEVDEITIRDHPFVRRTAAVQSPAFALQRIPLPLHLGELVAEVEDKLVRVAGETRRAIRLIFAPAAIEIAPTLRQALGCVVAIRVAVAGLEQPPRHGQELAERRHHLVVTGAG